MAIPNNYIDKITKGNDSRMISPAADMVRVDNENFEGTDLDGVLDEIAESISGAGGGTVKSVTVETQGDGTVDINVDDDTYTINLNHTHENMAKIVKCTEATKPAMMDNDTIYVQVDNSTTPTEIECLYLFGIEFTGGGVPDTGQPLISRPTDGTTISLGKNTGSGVSKNITIKGKNLTGDLTVTVGTGLSLTYGLSTGSSATIPLADALLGAQVTVAYNTFGGLTDGSLIISHGGDVLSAVTVVVEALLPSAYTQLEYISNVSRGLLTDVDAVVSKSPFVGTTWEVDVQMASAPSSTNIILCSNGDVGHWFGAASAGYTLGGGINFSVSATQRHLFEVKFIDLGLEVACNGETKSRTNANGFNHWGQQSGTIFKVSLLDELNGPTANVKYTGKVYSIKCTSGGSFNGIPAKRNSDNHFGLYDIENNVFYDLSVAS